MEHWKAIMFKNRTQTDNLASMTNYCIIPTFSTVIMNAKYPSMPDTPLPMGYGYIRYFTFSKTVSALYESVFLGLGELKKETTASMEMCL